MPVPSDHPGSSPARRSAGFATVFAAAWVAALALPNLLALPVWPWTPGLWTATGGEDATAFGLHDAIRALASSLVVSVVVLAAVGRFGWFALATLPLMMLVPIEAWYIVEYGQPSTAHALGVLAETNAEEAAEFHGGRIALPLLAYAAFALAAVSVAWRLQRTHQRWSHRSRAWVLAIALGTIAASALPTSFAGQAPAPAVRDPMTSVRDGWGPIVDDYAGIFPWGVPLRVADYAYQRQAIRAQVARAMTMQLHAKFDASRAPVDVVLVIGESARADRFGTGPGAPRTSPRLASIDGVVSFDDVVSQAPATRLAVPRIVAGLVDGDAARVDAQPSVVAAFREAGYHTWWISNHSTVGLHDNSITPYAEEAQVRRFVNAGSSNRRSALDGELVGELERALAAPAARRFVVVHMLGSHFNYRFRYPDAFDRFQPSLGRDQATSIFDVERRDQIRNAYDNSILYSDHVLAELIGTLARSGRESALLYVSDHGQVLFEGMCGKAGHGMPSALAYRVPMLVWMSPGMRTHRPGAYAALLAHRTVPLTIESVAPTLADLGAVDVPGATKRRSVASSALATAPRHVTLDGKRWVDFDRDIPALDCATALSRARPRSS